MARYGFAFFDSGARLDSPDAHPTTMRKLTKFLENPFDDPNISMDELLSFTTDHLGRMIANNPGNELDGRITATTNSLALLQQHATDDLVGLGVRKARNKVKGVFLADLPKKVAKIAAALVAEFGPDAPEVTVCFPQGRNVFNTATEDQMAGHIQTMINGLEGKPALAAALAAANALKTTWASVCGASDSAAGSKTATEQGKRLARENLQLMLFLTLLKLAEMFARQPEKLELYMRQSLLEDHPRGNGETEGGGGGTPPA